MRIKNSRHGTPGAGRLRRCRTKKPPLPSSKGQLPFQARSPSKNAHHNFRPAPSPVRSASGPRLTSRRKPTEEAASALERGKTARNNPPETPGRGPNLRPLTSPTIPSTPKGPARRAAPSACPTWRETWSGPPQLLQNVQRNGRKRSTLHQAAASIPAPGSTRAESARVPFKPFTLPHMSFPLFLNTTRNRVRKRREKGSIREGVPFWRP